MGTGFDDRMLQTWVNDWDEEDCSYLPPNYKNEE